MTADELMQTEVSSYLATLNAIKAQIRVCIPGKVTAYHKDKGTVDVQPVIRETLCGSERTLPLLLDVPVYYPGDKNMVITYTIEPQSECIVVFADNAIDAWLKRGGVQGQVVKRRHDLSDGFAFVGFRSEPNKAPEPEGKMSLFVNNECSVTVSETGVVTLKRGKWVLEE